MGVKPSIKAECPAGFWGRFSVGQCYFYGAEAFRCSWACWKIARVGQS